ncbi:10199_t:CDS:1, partial [Cetraspora pellucida]
PESSHNKEMRNFIWHQCKVGASKKYSSEVRRYCSDVYQLL